MGPPATFYLNALPLASVGLMIDKSTTRMTAGLRLVTVVINCVDLQQYLDLLSSWAN